MITLVTLDTATPLQFQQTPKQRWKNGALKKAYTAPQASGSMRAQLKDLRAKEHQTFDRFGPCFYLNSYPGYSGY